MTEKTREFLSAGLLLIVLSFLYLLTVTDYWIAGPDSALYISLARALARGEGFAFSGEPHFIFPPVFPLILTPLIYLFGMNILLMRLLVVGLSLGSLVVLYRLVRNCDGPAFALLLTAVTGVSSAVVASSTYIQSEIPFIFLSLLGLFLIQRYSDGVRLLGLRLALAVSFCLLAFFTRPSGGAALVGAGALFLAGTCDRRKGMIFGALTVAPIAAYALWLRQGSGQDRLMHEKIFLLKRFHDPDLGLVGIGDLALRVLANVRDYTLLLSEAVFGVKGASGVFIFSLSVLSLMVISAGFVLTLRTGPTLRHYYLVVYLGVLLLIGPKGGMRYLVPVLPLVYYDFLTGVAALTRAVPAPKKLGTSFGLASWAGARALGLVLITAVLIANLVRDVGVVSQERGRPGGPRDADLLTSLSARTHDPRYSEFFTALEWIRSHTPANALVVSDSYPLVHLLTERPSVAYPWTRNDRQIMAYLRARGAGYVILDQQYRVTSDFLAPAIQRNAEAFNLRFRVKNTLIYELRDR